MGQIEAKVKKQIRMAKIQKAVLGVVASAGIMTMAVVAPNALQSLGIFFKGKNRDKLHYTKTSIGRLIDNGFLQVSVSKNGKKEISLTKKGEDKVNEIEIKNYKISIPKRWDKKYRIVIFDIDERRKNDRDELRFTLLRMGFVRLQNSVWVYPYDCEDLITLLKTKFHLGTSVLYIIADHIENDKWLKKEFGLSNK